LKCSGRPSRRRTSKAASRNVIAPVFITDPGSEKELCSEELVAAGAGTALGAG
jgi:hypothetical protein